MTPADATNLTHRLLREERGAALVIALMSMLLLTALGLSLVLTTTSETMIAGNYREGQEALYAADAGLERAMQDLLTVADWNEVLRGQTTSAFIDGGPDGLRTLPNGAELAPLQVANMANCGKLSGCSASELIARTLERPWAANNPVFQPYAYGPIEDLLPTATINSRFYVVVLVGDDPSENDGDPLTDGVALTNPGRGVLTLRAEAFGPRGARKVIEATVARTDSAELERGYVGQRGQDEQNRRARKAPVQTPGRALTRSEMSTTTGGMAVR
jgi:hypothetical protein